MDVSDCYLLPLLGEAILPRAMPLGLGLPPVIAVGLTLMRPVPDLLAAALRDQLTATPWAEPKGTGSGLYSVFVKDSKSHEWNMGDAELDAKWHRGGSKFCQKNLSG